MDVWEAFVDLALPLGEVREQRSRYADKPALVLGAREIAHTERSGVIDLRITYAAWRGLRDEFGQDPCVHADPGRREWVELTVTVDDLARLRPLVEAAVRANG